MTDLREQARSYRGAGASQKWVFAAKRDNLDNTAGTELRRF
jgi:hypothetical protein